MPPSAILVSQPIIAASEKDNIFYADILRPEKDEPSEFKNIYLKGCTNKERKCNS